MIVTLAVRVLQILFSVVTLALAAVLVAQYGPGHAPSLFSYGAFCGAASIIIAFIGVAACFFDKLQGIVMLVLDGFASFFLVAGGIAYAVTLKVGNCADHSDFGYLSHHLKTFQPSTKKFDDQYNGHNLNHIAQLTLNDTIARCRMAQADTAFLWFSFACAAGCVVLSFFVQKRGSSSIV